MRRFQELRSANNTIAGAASLAAGLLYGLGGCILGVLWLLRRHWLLWRPALVAGLVVGGLMGAMLLSAAPTAWFGFDTAQSVSTFWTRQIGAAVLVTVGGAVAYGLAFMAAESLSRRAFGEHPQLWRVWSRDAAPTRAGAGPHRRRLPVRSARARADRVVLLRDQPLARLVAALRVADRSQHPRQPPIPALSPIALSLQAGFMEECIFRAVPLSLAALIGARYGYRRLAIGDRGRRRRRSIFGGAHANYPGFPAYSRLVELLVPSMLWALIFLRYGLLPTIILHGTLRPRAVRDSAVPGRRARRRPAARARHRRGTRPARRSSLARRVAGRRWRELAPTTCATPRGSPRRPPRTSTRPRATARPPRPPDGSRRSSARCRCSAVAGFGAWVLCTPFRADAPPLPQGRAQAEAQADAALKARGVDARTGMARSSAPRLASDDPVRSGVAHSSSGARPAPKPTARLLGRALAPPLWEVRYALFDGPVADRAEEWRVTVNPDGTPRFVRHALPEGRAGTKLGRDAALALAERALREQLRCTTRRRSR